MMGAFGKFLEVSLPAGDVLRSLDFYRAIGFTELTTGDIRRWHYAVVTDGQIALGLHGEGIAEPALSFVRPNLARQVAQLRESGLEFEFSRLGPEEFNEAALRTPDGQLVLMLEARTFSPGTAASAAMTLVGQCTEVSLACADLALSRAFFEGGGFLAEEESGSDAVRLQAPGISVGLRVGAPRPVATLRFCPADLRDSLRRLEALGINVARGPEGHALTAPEGTRLLLAG